MAEEERNKAKQDLQKHEDELDRAQREHDAIKSKLVALERKIIVGGENLLEKAEEQVGSRLIVMFVCFLAHFVLINLALPQAAQRLFLWKVV